MKWTISWAAANNTSLIWSIVPSSLVNTAGWEHHAVHAAFWKCHLRGPHRWRRLRGLAVWTPCWPKDPHSWPPYTPMSFLSFLRHLKKKKWGWLIDTHTFVIFNIPSLCSEEALVLAHFEWQSLSERGEIGAWTTQEDACAWNHQKMTGNVSTGHRGDDGNPPPPSNNELILLPHDVMTSPHLPIYQDTPKPVCCSMSVHTGASLPVSVCCRRCVCKVV